jgi:hypothetical protein
MGSSFSTEGRFPSGGAFVLNFRSLPITADAQVQHVVLGWQ